MRTLKTLRTPRTLRTFVLSSLIITMSSSAFAGDLQAAIAKATNAAEQTPAQQAPPRSDAPMPKGYLWLGSGLFVAGLATGLYGFLNNSNGSFPTFGEATSTNVKMGAAGLATAFAGGAILFLGKRKANGSTTSIALGPRQMTVSKRLTW
jgi:hypothetical protein